MVETPDERIQKFYDTSSGMWEMIWGEHMPDQQKFLEECYRVLMPEGTLVMATWCHRPISKSGWLLTADERQHLEQIYWAYCLPYTISLPEYAAIAQTIGFQNIRTADWSTAVAPFWDEAIA